jgi:hypothetical protein
LSHEMKALVCIFGWSVVPRTLEDGDYTTVANPDYAHT